MNKLAGILATLLLLVGFWFYRSETEDTDEGSFQPLPPVAATSAHLADSKYPVAIEPQLVGSYPSKTDSGAGYFYDDVLEYRVWIDPQSGGERLNSGSDYFRAFATFEQALEYSSATQGAEPPLVLVRQLEHVNEPETGLYEHITEERITEWQTGWLDGTKRQKDSIAKFLAEHATKAKKP